MFPLMNLSNLSLGCISRSGVACAYPLCIFLFLFLALQGSFAYVKYYALIEHFMSFFSQTIISLINFLLIFCAKVVLMLCKEINNFLNYMWYMAAV